MNPTHRISETGYFSHPSQSAVTPRPLLGAGAQTRPPAAKPDSNEAYLSSCRPTRLSMEMISQMRAQGSK